MNVPVRSIFGLAKTTSAIFLSIALVACTMPTTILFANGTAHSVTVFYKDGRDNMATLLVAAGATVEIEHLMSRNFSLQIGESRFFYERAFPPTSYFEYVGFGPFTKHIVKAQLASDGCVYLVASKDVMPSQSLKAQPPEFPLCPAATGNQQPA